MTFDWDEFSRLSDEEKVEYMRRKRDADLEAAKGKTFPPGSIAPEKARFQEGSQVVGRMNPDGTIHYYSEDEKRAMGIVDDTTDTSDPDADTAGQEDE